MICGKHLFGRSENPDPTDADWILPDRPQEWGTEALTEHRSKLAAKHIGVGEVFRLPLVSVDDITYLLNAAEQGDSGAASQLLPLVYEKLRRLAAQRLAQEKPGQTLEATALVHEAYLRLVNVELSQEWNGRGHFFAAAAEAMRRILVENARRKNRLKHGGDRVKIDLHSELVAAHQGSDDLLALDDALTRLAATEPQVAKLVQLRYFGGLKIKEAAEILRISPRTADTYWAYARSWLRAELRGDDA